MRTAAGNNLAGAVHRMPVATLRRIFAVLLYVQAMKMLWTYL